VNTAAPATADPTPVGEALQLEIVAKLSALLDLVPTVAALADSHQRGLGFLTYEARQVQNELIRKERRDQLKATILGRPLGHGPTSAPGNFPAITTYVEIWAASRHQIRRLVRWQAKNGTVPTAAPAVDQVPVDSATAIQLLRMLRPLVWEVTEDKVLRAVLADLEQVTELAERLIDGPSRVPYPDAQCPHCGRPTLVAYFVRGVVESVTCDNDQTTGARHPCTCPDPLCECKQRPIAHRHTWHRQRANKPDGLLTLSGLLKRNQNATNEGTRP
jgi:hypothetical protein